MGSEKATYIYACQTGTSNSVKQHRLRKMIAWLSDKEGVGKEFISLYIPPNSSPDQIITTLKNQSKYATMNHESVQDRFQDAFKNLLQHLKLKKEISENGLALFAGTFAVNDQKGEVASVEEIVPPEPVATYLYEVDDHFHLEPLREMLRNPRVVGIVAMDSKEASFGLLNGERLEFIKDITSGIPGKSGKGGQSQRRYERERDMELTYFFHRIAEHATKAFLEDHRIIAMIVGGPGSTKNDFLKGNYLHYELQNAILSTVDTQSVGKEGVKEILEKSSEAISNMCAPEEKMVAHRLLAELAKQDGLAIYGLYPVLNALRNEEVELVIITDSTNLIEIGAMCKKCGLRKTEIVDKKEKTQTIRKMLSNPCERCNSHEYEVEEKDIVDVLEDAASQTDARVEVISTESDEKAQLTALGGIAAILRYKPK
ncbi:MAG: peptide chain release factor aRF-1 [Candidatus Bathyarchaeota archaeon]|nr:peptide chain release factor aRF-1 [Candidatus Bathyarchaeota archaeon]